LKRQGGKGDAQGVKKGIPDRGITPWHKRLMPFIRQCVKDTDAYSPQDRLALLKSASFPAGKTTENQITKDIIFKVFNCMKSWIPDKSIRG